MKKLTVTEVVQPTNFIRLNMSFNANSVSISLFVIAGMILIILNDSFALQVENKQDNLSRQALLEQIEVQSNMIKSLEKRMNEERDLYERQMDRHVAQLSKTIELTQKSLDSNTQLAVLTISAIFLFGVGLYGFLFGRKMNEVEKRMVETFNIRSKQILDETVGEIDEHIKNAIGEKIEESEAKINKANAVLDKFLAYKQRKFLWLYLENEESINQELLVLQNEGISDITTRACEPTLIRGITEYDVLIFSYNGSDKAFNSLQLIVEELRKAPHHVFLTLYIFNPDAPIRLEKKEIDVLKNYPWYQLASFPMTLISVAKTFVR